MSKKVLSFVKVSLLVCTLVVLGVGVIAQPAEADITIYCDGSDNLCAVYEDPEIIIEFWLGEWFLIVID